jgi:hypothetical protein
MLDPAVRPIRSRRSRRDLWCRFDLDENGRAAPAGKRQRTGSPLFVSPLPCRQRPALSGRLEWKERGNEIAPLGERVSRLALRLLEAMRMHRSSGRRMGSEGRDLARVRTAARGLSAYSRSRSSVSASLSLNRPAPISPPPGSFIHCASTSITTTFCVSVKVTLVLAFADTAIVSSAG